MLDNLRRKRSQISDTLYASVLTRLYAFSRKVLNLNLGKLRLGSQAHKSFRYFNQKGSLPYELCRENGVVFKMIYCPVGTFEMGHADQKNNQPSPEMIGTSFLLGETEVTQELYQTVMENNPSHFKNRPQNPVEMVSWEDATKFCNKLSDLQGLEKCYATRKTRVGILRSETPSGKKQLVQYDNFYNTVRDHILESIKKYRFYNVELALEYDPDISTCDVFVTDRWETEEYSIEPNWLKKLELKGKIRTDLEYYAGVQRYKLLERAKEGLDDFLKKSNVHIVSCNFSKNGYRLPTEKEWEYAAKAGTQNRWAGTDIEAKLGEYAWFGEDQETGSTHAVKSKDSNEWGFYDMSGNVWEWCWGRDEYNPEGKTSNYLNMLGGCYYRCNASNLRVTYRGSVSSDSKGYSLGFRICRTLV